MFRIHHQAWHAEDLALADLADQYGTPLYVYSAAQITENYHALHAALARTGLRTHIHYAVKANYNLAVLRHLKNLDAGADVVSGGEMQRAMAAGIAAGDIIFSGVGKTDAELQAAMSKNIHQINLESAEEMMRLSTLARQAGKTVDCAVRINPDVDAGTHAKINTGKSEHKFGVDLQTASAMFAAARAMPELNLRGLAMHIGSQLMDAQPFDDAFAVMAEFARELQQKNFTVDRIDIGGGLGVPYHANEKSADLDGFTATIKKHFTGFDGDLYTEPGRYLVANAGVLLTRIVFIKRTAHKTFVVLDAAMNDLMRPALYDAYHPIYPVVEENSPMMTCDIVGGICETSDIFAADRKLPETLKAGDLMVIGVAGAYGTSMASTYNARDLVPEVMVSGDQSALVRQRWSITEQLKLENIPEWMNRI